MFTLKSPAKINWSLYVLNKRDDGYHNILSLMHCIGLYDTLIFEDSDALEIITDMDLPVEQNLVFKAAQMLQRHTGIKKGARIKLEKDIPSGAGLGGGSSDAAYTLVGLNRLWGLGLSGDELKTIGSSLGSDVSFFFANIAGNPLAITEGRGEVLTPLKINIPFILLLVKPPLSVSTSWAYEKIDAKSKEHRAKSKSHITDSMPYAPCSLPDVELTKIEDKINNIQLIYKLLLTGETRLLGSIIYNDFEDIVIEKHPVIRILKDEILKAGASLSLMSGSGSTVFGIFEDKDRAIKASERLSSYWNRVVLTAVSSEAEDGASASGKPADFGSAIPRFESWRPS